MTHDLQFYIDGLGRASIRAHPTMTEAAYRATVGLCRSKLEAEPWLSNYDRC